MMFAVGCATGNLRLSTVNHNNLLLRRNKAHIIYLYIFLKKLHRETWLD